MTDKTTESKPNASTNHFKYRKRERDNEGTQRVTELVLEPDAIYGRTLDMVLKNGVWMYSLTQLQQGDKVRYLEFFNGKYTVRGQALPAPYHDPNPTDTGYATFADLWRAAMEVE